MKKLAPLWLLWLLPAITLAFSTGSASAAPTKCGEEKGRSLSNKPCEEARDAFDPPTWNGTTPQVVDDSLVIEDVTLISPERPSPVPHISVVIRNGRIAQIAPGLVAGPHATRMDGHNRFLIPGLIDSHVHVGDTGPLDDDAIAAHPELLQAYQSQLPRAFLAFGFTTLVDLNSAEEGRDRFISAPVHPNLYHCGPAVHALGGYGALRPPKDAAAANAANLVYEVAQAKDWPAFLDPRAYTPARDVDRVVHAGGVCVKVFVEPGFGGVFHWPVPSAETLAAFRAETRRSGLVLIIHANAVESWQAALDAHADVIAHGLWHWPGDRFAKTPPAEAREVIHQAHLAGVRVQPTLQVLYGELSVFDRSLLEDPRLAAALPRVLVAYLKGEEAQAAARAMQDQYRQIFAKLQAPASMDVATAMSIAPARVTATLRIMLAEKVKLLFGSDTPSGDGGIGNPPGLNGRLELSRWAEAGVPLSSILRASTLDNAVAFGLSKDLGTIEVGKRADLLLLRADPLQSVAAYDTIETVILNGSPLPRSSLLPAN
jgi:imidazolonepropionase-like amidohydrolase